MQKNWRDSSHHQDQDNFLVGGSWTTRVSMEVSN